MASTMADLFPPRLTIKIGNEVFEISQETIDSLYRKSLFAGIGSKLSEYHHHCAHTVKQYLYL